MNTKLTFNLQCLKVGVPPGHKVQLISQQDIGWFAADALLQPEKWAGRKFSLAGGEKSFEEMDKRYRARFGQPIPLTSPWPPWVPVAPVIKYVLAMVQVLQLYVSWAHYRTCTLLTLDLSKSRRIPICYLHQNI
jgi:hypothetical protein